MPNSAGADDVELLDAIVLPGVLVGRQRHCRTRNALGVLVCVLGQERWRERRAMAMDMAEELLASVYIVGWSEVVGLVVVHAWQPLRGRGVSCVSGLEN